MLIETNSMALDGLCKSNGSLNEKDQFKWYTFNGFRWDISVNREC